MPSEESYILPFLHKQLQVKRWMESILRVPIDIDFCVSLRSGIILCYLAKTIDDDLVPLIHDSKNHYKQLENVSAFIQACRELRVPLLRTLTLEDFEKKACCVLRRSAHT